jgi:hypothetical protein
VQGLNMVQDSLFLGKGQTVSSLTTTPSKMEEKRDIPRHGDSGCF